MPDLPPDELASDQNGPASRRSFLGRLLSIGWWLLAAVALLTYLRGPGLRTVAGASELGWTDPATVIDVLRTVIVGALIVVLFAVGAGLFRKLTVLAVSSPPEREKGDSGSEEEPEPEEEGKEEEGVGFPEPPTVGVAYWLVAISLVFTWGLIESLAPTFFSAERFEGLSCTTGERCGELRNLLVTMFAAGIGATVTTILGYLDHAGTKKDFEESYVPWYFARPLLGILMGVIFYFVVKGGLFATVGGQAADEVDVHGLAALAALVGLFSKQAIEKLRELFHTLFVTRRDLEEQLEEEADDEEATGDPEEGSDQGER